MNDKPKDLVSGEEEIRFLSALRESLALAMDRGLEEYAGKLKRLIEVGQLISSSLEMDAIVNQTLQSMKEIMGTKWCVLELYDQETGAITVKGSREADEELLGETGRMLLESTTLKEIVKTASPLFIDDLARYDGPLQLSFLDRDVKAAAIVPVQARGKTLGVIILCLPFPRQWKEDEKGYLSIIASQVGLALENARLYATLQEYYMSVVKALAAALEAKDKYTQGHSFRVAWWARVIAREMKLSENEQEMVYIGGLLHDIGKVGIREHILLKKGGLTPEEKKEIMTHPRIGAKILKPANLPREVVAAVLYHHEDYNGGGYPEGLTGKRIPLLARIIRVADAYDAMKSDRPYRKAFSQQWIIEELRRCAGKQFDPAVVEAMQKVLEREPEDTIELSREKYLDFIGKLSSLE